MVGREWSQGELGELVQALRLESTEIVGKRFGLNPKSIRSLLGRRGLKLRHLRRPEPSARPLGGILARRSADAPAAIYGAVALAELLDHACHWPIGDPSQPDFEFCGAPVAGRGAYCPTHMARAYSPAPPLILPLVSRSSRYGARGRA